MIYMCVSVVCVYIYNTKRESMKDYKYFFYQYSEIHVFTRQSSLVSNKNDVNLGGHPGPRYTRRTKPSHKNI